MSSGEPICREAERRHRHHVRAVQREQPVRRADEPDVVVIAAGAGIAHHLRDGQTLERFGEGLLQAALERLALGEAVQIDILGLAVGGDADAVGPVLRVERCGGEAGAPESREFPHERCGRLARRIARHLHRHQLVDDLRVRCDGHDFRDRDGQPPRRRERGDRGFGRQEPAVGETRDEAVGKGFAEPAQRLRRQFLGEQLDDERGGKAHCGAPLALRAFPPRGSDSRLGRPGALMPRAPGARRPAWGSRAPRGSRRTPARPAGKASVSGRCTRRARSPRSRRAHRAG